MSEPRQALVTGASSGIGRAVADALLARGWHVWGCARDASRLSGHENLHQVTLELADAAALDEAFARALADAGHFDALINNAGFAHFAPLLDIGHTELAREWQVMVAAPLRLVQLATPTLASRGGIVVNVTSLAADMPIPCMGGYSACKAALANLSATLRHEFAAQGLTVRVVDVQPGDTRTDFNAHMPTPTVADERRAWARRVRRACDTHCAEGAAVEAVAARVVTAVEGAGGPVQRAGTFSQARLAPLARRLLPVRWMERMLQRYYE